MSRYVRKPGRHNSKGGGSPTSPRRLAIFAKRHEALRMRLLGMSWRAIAERLGLQSHTTLIEAVDVLLRDTISADLEAVRELELQRLDYYLQQLEPRINDSDVRAIDCALKTSRRRSELLGLDAPVKAPVDKHGNAVGVNVVVTYEDRISHAASHPPAAPAYGAGARDQ